jgi:hypothetical protein
MIKDEKGIAMVLAVTFVGLLAGLGLYLILESSIAFRMTRAMERHESVFNISEGGVQLGLRYVRSNSPSVNYAQILGGGPLPTTFPSAHLPSYMQLVTLGPGSLQPLLDYLGYRTIPPAGWGIGTKTHGAQNFHGLFYRPRGEGRIALPSLKTAGDNDALNRNSNVAFKVQK